MTRPLEEFYKECREEVREIFKDGCPKCASYEKCAVDKQRAESWIISQIERVNADRAHAYEILEFTFCPAFFKDGEIRKGHELECDIQTSFMMAYIGRTRAFLRNKY